MKKEPMKCLICHKIGVVLYHRNSFVTFVCNHCNTVISATDTGELKAKLLQIKRGERVE